MPEDFARRWSGKSTDGRFQTATYYAIDSTYFSVAVGDFNADGRAEVLWGGFACPGPERASVAIDGFTPNGPVVPGIPMFVPRIPLDNYTKAVLWSALDQVQTHSDSYLFTSRERREFFRAFTMPAYPTSCPHFGICGTSLPKVRSHNARRRRRSGNYP